MGYKYIVLDFGKVVIVPKTGNWDITPKFLELIDMNKVDVNLLKEAIKKYSYILSEKVITLDEEYEAFSKYYDNILKEINYPNYERKIAKEIAYERIYKHENYILCENIIEELSNLKNKYLLLMITDNWPCVINYLKESNIYDYFEKIYISSVYGAEKQDKILFDYPIKDYNIKPGEALFIDDIESNLDVAKEKGFDCMLMDRYKKDIKSKYKVINDLLSI